MSQEDQHSQETADELISGMQEKGMDEAGVQQLRDVYEKKGLMPLWRTVHHRLASEEAARIDGE